MDTTPSDTPDVTTAQPETRSFEEAAAPADALALLRRDHEEVLDVADQYARCEDALGKALLAERLCLLLTVHAQIEEEIFYPALRQAGVRAALINEAVVEHMTLRQLVADVESASAEDALLDAKVQVLGDYVRRHVGDEEAELFPLAEAHLDLVQLGLTLSSRRAQLCREAAAQLKARLRSGGPAAQMTLEHPTASVQAMPGPVRAAAAAADLALAVLPGGGRLRRMLRPQARDDQPVPTRPTWP